MREFTWQRLLFLATLALLISVVLPLTSQALQGGPDSFGYHYRDSNDVGGPQYVWEDIQKTGTKFEGFDKPDKGYPNTMAPAIPIGFDFNFYGRNYQWVRLAGNGYITFSLNHNRNYVYDGAQVPAKSEPNNIIAPFWSWNDTFS